MPLSDISRSVCAVLERGLPLLSSPFGALAQELGISEIEVIEAAESLRASGTLRHFGAFVDFRPLGFRGYLFGVHVSCDVWENIVAWLEGMRCVTHIYERDAPLNLWFTAILPDDESAAGLSEGLVECGCPHVALAATRRIKLKPSFAQEGGPLAGGVAMPAESEGVRPFSLTPLQRRMLHLAQTAFPISPRPFAQIAAMCDVSEDVALEDLRELVSAGVLRRIGASVHHVRSGYAFNSLIAWDLSDLPEGDVAAAAMRVSVYPWLSHCYVRRVFVNTLGYEWRYNLYTMIHARSEEELRGCEETLSSALDGHSFMSMRTEGELKKTPYRIDTDQGHRGGSAMNRPMRRKKKEVTDVKWMEGILRKGQVIYLGLATPDGKPYVVPMGYGYGDGALYIHGARGGLKNELIANNPHVSFNVSLDTELVSDTVGSEFTMKYKSVSGYGKARELTELDEKNRALQILMNQYDGPHTDLTEKNKDSVWIVRIDIEHMSGKISGYPNPGEN